MKKLAIFCDGTWNDLRMKDRTNVSRLAKCVLPVGKDTSGAACPQIVFYDEGVGVGSHVSRIADEAVRLFGGALGRGLDRKVEVAYRFLVTNYEPGDDIYIFGFSRGAYTARSLCGMIRRVGILKREYFDMTPQAFDLYYEQTYPSDPRLIDFRFRFGHDVASGNEDYRRYLSDQDLEAITPLVEGDEHEPLAFGALPELFQSRDLNSIRARQPTRQLHGWTETSGARGMHTYRLMYLGLWDTVGELGLPGRLGPLGRWTNRKYAFHDTDADPLIASLRHAVAGDETRDLFSSTPVSNIRGLNRTWAQRRGYDVGDPASPMEPDVKPGASDYVPYAYRPFQQRFFPGDHGAVGGGNPQLGLSSHTLRWIAEGADWAGLSLKWEDVPGPESELESAKACTAATAVWPGVDKPDLLGRLGGHQPRVGPARSLEIGNTAYMRYCVEPTYRPKAMAAMAGQPFPRVEPAPPTGWPPCTVRTWPI